MTKTSDFDTISNVIKCEKQTKIFHSIKVRKIEKRKAHFTFSLFPMITVTKSNIS